MAETDDTGASPRKRRSNRKDAAAATTATAGNETVLSRRVTVLGIATAILSLAMIVGAYFLFAADHAVRQMSASLAQLRAYVGYQQVIYAPQATVEPGRPITFQGSAIGVSWKNLGATPAKELEYWMSAKWYPAGTEPDFSKPSENLPGRSVMTLGVGAESPSPPLFVPAADIEKAMSGNGKVFFWGDAVYRDVFPDTPPRRFHFCLVAVNLPKTTNEPAAFNAYKPACNFSD